MTLTQSIVYLVDVDNTLIDNDGIQQDLKDHLEQVYGLASRVRYWKILADLFEEVGYRDYLGALQRYRAEHPRQVELLSMSSFHTTVFPRQGSYAHDARALATFPPAAVTVESIGDLLDCDLSRLGATVPSANHWAVP